jgi:hypothetical protein
MAYEKVHEILTGALTQDYINAKLAEGWRPVAVVWERGDEGARARVARAEDVPFGYRVADDCAHLEESPVIAEVIVHDRPFSQIPDVLNQRGLRTREGSAWNRVSVFNLLPRLIEAAPTIYASPDWVQRRAR